MTTATSILYIVTSVVGCVFLARAYEIGPRKNINDLSAAELTIFRDAFTDIVNNGEFVKIAGDHGVPRTFCPHGSKKFLPWHRRFIERLEMALGVALPYWDWTVGPQLPQACLDQTYVNGAGATVPNPLLSGPKVDINGQRTMRNINAEFPFSQLSAAVSLCMAQQDFSVMSDTLEQAHNDVHGGCGGDMNSLDYSSYDPIFWLNHNNVDRIWFRWQLANKFAMYPSEARGTLMDSLGAFSGEKFIKDLSGWMRNSSLDSIGKQDRPRDDANGIVAKANLPLSTTAPGADGGRVGNATASGSSSGVGSSSSSGGSSGVGSSSSSGGSSGVGSSSSSGGSSGVGSSSSSGGSSGVGSSSSSGGSSGAGNASSAGEKATDQSSLNDKVAAGLGMTPVNGGNGKGAGSSGNGTQTAGGSKATSIPVMDGPRTNSSSGSNAPSSAPLLRTMAPTPKPTSATPAVITTKPTMSTAPTPAPSTTPRAGSPSMAHDAMMREMSTMSKRFIPNDPDPSPSLLQIPLNFEFKQVDNATRLVQEGVSRMPSSRMVCVIKDVKSTHDPCRLDVYLKDIRIGYVYLLGMGDSGMEYTMDRYLDITEPYNQLLDGCEVDKIQESFGLQMINEKTGALEPTPPYVVRFEPMLF